jgi:hypothetical protein
MTFSAFGLKWAALPISRQSMRSKIYIESMQKRIKKAPRNKATRKIPRKRKMLRKWKKTKIRSNIIER